MPQPTPPFQDKAAFLAGGLEAYIDVAPETFPPSILESTSPSLTSGPLFPEPGDNSTTASTPEPIPHSLTCAPISQDHQRTTTTAPPADTQPTTPASTSSYSMDDTPLPNCPICLDPLTSTPPSVKIRSCRHAYHFACLKSWLDRRNTCPACRRVLYGEQALPVITRVFEGEHVSNVTREGVGAAVEVPARQVGHPGSRHWAARPSLRGVGAGMVVGFGGGIGGGMPIGSGSGYIGAGAEVERWEAQNAFGPVSPFQRTGARIGPRGSGRDRSLSPSEVSRRGARGAGRRGAPRPGWRRPGRWWYT